ncbi:MotA/TolQ/ExbB proton channel family protein [Thauera butanivorans]|uniref:MotA/TolQ/ExbB proton channel family protein n=1 Tax=Thauera butanivorans TaxID=86174 RepID=UPI003AB26906
MIRRPSFATLWPRLLLAAAVLASPLAHAQADEATVVENPYGLEALWAAGDFVAKGTLAILVLMSVGSWFIILTKLFEQSRLLRQGRKAKRTFWAAGDVEKGLETLDSRSAYHYIARTGSESTAHHVGLLGFIDLNDWIQLSIQRSIEKVQSRLQSGLAFLATVGSTAPFVGLFGTVWGIYHALTAIGVSGQASIDKVAGPVGEALIMTAIGLAVAVPAVLGYNWLVRRNKAALDDVRNFGAELHAVLLGAQAARSAAQAPQAAPRELHAVRVAAG